MVTLGIENIKNLVAGNSNKKVGIITNNIARSSSLTSVLDILVKKIGREKIVLLTPEHGYYGTAQAGLPVGSGYDNELNVMVESLYRDSKKGSSSKDQDSEMRNRDSIRDESKYPTKETMESLDSIICDLVDIGCRIYTNIATMVYTMSQSPNDQNFIVLDRPNPINGRDMDGPILDRKLFSFIGALPIPMRHSMTLGELALFFNKFENESKANLKVVSVEGWSRNTWNDQCQLDWIPSSPNIPTLTTATLYPGTVLFEGTNMSEGRGTTLPFQLIGAPWIKSDKFIRELKEEKLDGIKFMDFKFRPTFSKHVQEVCNGVLLIPEKRDLLKPFSSTLKIISIIQRLFEDDFKFFDSYFDKASGKDTIRKGITDGKGIGEILSPFQGELDNFMERKKEIVLYG